MSAKKGTVIVFGGSGFLGSAVVKKLLAKNYQVTVFDITLPRVEIKGVKYINGDICDIDLIRAVMPGNEIIYNFAGAADLEGSIRDPLRYLNLNILGNANILQAAIDYGGVRRFVYASSAYALSNKGAFYGTSKRASEKITQLYQENYALDYTILRYGSVYGPFADETNRIYRFIRDALLHGEISFQGDGSEEREYIHVDDAADLSVKILEDFGKNENFILTGTERFDYKELLEMIREIIGPQLKINFMKDDYKGHYNMTPYKFEPDLGKKITNNPSIDFGQGVLQCVQSFYEKHSIK
jgi:UDP-glucose 4-epimerase